eukprot:4815240-Prymnesium_polylepis.1
MSNRIRMELAVDSMYALDSRSGQAPSACVTPDFHMKLAPVISRTYPDVRYKVTRDPVTALADGTSCGAYLTYNRPAEMANPSACWLHTVDQAVFTSEAGWISPYKSACVAEPIELAMLELKWNGALDNLYSLHMGRPPTCTIPSTAEGRRRLTAPTSHTGPPIMAPIMGRAHHSRELRGTGLDVEEESASDEVESMSLGWQDLVGLHS